MGRASRGCPPPFQQAPYGRRGHDLQRRDRLDPALRCRLAARAILSPDRRAAAARIERPRLGCGCGEDRKSVVSGKSVSVRVDLGGRRIIKKKTKKKNQE